MGARGYVAFDFDDDQRIVLYTHWDARETGRALQEALRTWPSYQSFVVDVALRTIRQTKPYCGRTVQEWSFDLFVHVPESEFQEAWLCAD